MNNPYKNADLTPSPQVLPLGTAFPASGGQLNWTYPSLSGKASRSGRLERKFLNLMDYVFTIIILLSGEKEYEMIAIDSIL